MTNNDHLIWSNYDLDFEEWKEWIQTEYPKLSPSEQIQMMYELNDEHLADERINLDIQLNRPILIVGDLGLWNGRRMGYKEIPSGNISDCLYSDTDYSTWFVDKKGDMRCDAVHHDGTNHYLYRVYKDNATDAQIDRLKQKIYDGVATPADIRKVTKRIGDEVAKVYGFELPKEVSRKSLER